jgi:hypothetical protein
MTTRRGLLKGILAAGMAPAAIGSGILMPVKEIAGPSPILWADTGLLAGWLDDMTDFPKTATEIQRRHEQVSRGIAFQMRAEQARENARFRRWLDDAQIVMSGKPVSRSELANLAWRLG